MFGKIKAQLRYLQVGVMALFSIGLTVMMLLLFAAQTQNVAGSITGNNSSPAVVAITQLISAFQQIPLWFPLIILVVIFVAIWGLFRLMQGVGGGASME